MSSNVEPMRKLLRIMARLRDPEHGCQWDLQQNFASVAAHTIEEAYEVVDAIDRDDHDALRDELGDLLFQVVFHARIGEEAGLFDFGDVAQAIADKLVRRHPHVFGDVCYANADEQARAWEAIKASERAEKGTDDDASALAGIARGLPEWRRALKLQQRAAAVGFDWPSAQPVLDKLEEELSEVREEFRDGSAERIEEEIGDMLFVLVNLTRHAGVDFSRALRRANAKFERRFRYMEGVAREQGSELSRHSLNEQDQWWEQAKLAERSG